MPNVLQHPYSCTVHYGTANKDCIIDRPLNHGGYIAARLQPTTVDVRNYHDTNRKLGLPIRYVRKASPHSQALGFVTKSAKRVLSHWTVLAGGLHPPDAYMNAALVPGLFALVVLAGNLSGAPIIPRPPIPSIPPGSTQSESRQPASTPSITDAPEPATYLIVGAGLILVSVGTARLRRRSG